MLQVLNFKNWQDDLMDRWLPPGVLNMISMQRVAINRVPWDELDRFADLTVYQTLPWINFVAQAQSAEPMIAMVKENGNTVGYFTGPHYQKVWFENPGQSFSWVDHEFSRFQFASRIFSSPGTGNAPFLRLR
jgi:hypothetical protein